MNGWKQDKQYIKLFNDTLDIIGLPNRRAGIAVGEFKGYNLVYQAKYAANFDGDMAEVGTWIGGSARMIAKTVPNKILHCFDTFEGIPEVDENVETKDWLVEFRGADIYETALKATSDCDNVAFYKGIFPGTIPEKLYNESFCFVHADADVYPSTKAICEFFYDRLTPGGVLLFDDYGFKKASGVRKAVNEYFEDKPENPVMISGGQCIVIRADLSKI